MSMVLHRCKKQRKQMMKHHRMPFYIPIFRRSKAFKMTARRWVNYDDYIRTSEAIVTGNFHKLWHRLYGIMDIYMLYIGGMMVLFTSNMKHFYLNKNKSSKTLMHKREIKRTNGIGHFILL